MQRRIKEECNRRNVEVVRDCNLRAFILTGASSKRVEPNDICLFWIFDCLIKDSDTLTIKLALVGA